MTNPAPTIWYVNGVKNCIRAGLGIASFAGTVKVVLLDAAYVLDQDVHDFLDDVIAHEVAGGGTTGYTAGGVTLGSLTTAADSATNTASFDGADITGLNLSACYAVVCLSTGTSSTSPLYTVTDLSGGTGVNVTVTFISWNSLGIAGLTAA